MNFPNIFIPLIELSATLEYDTTLFQQHYFSCCNSKEQTNLILSLRPNLMFEDLDSFENAFLSRSFFTAENFFSQG